ncbi:glyceraldehyde-3-phosphate dehydrogenase(GAP) [Monocercomonoides exilis]|uniref:Glyceraldehyde-3-phosphate dehydrogenase n=1 Tax=Monocercomonoides exilis TaxID=2049356 RepID=A1BQS4_9EUKA|nr:glyceraldehyde-3-phosphate dehydrogenase [Monocercomonoides exilis]KAH7818755.1 glyceraldehyde-3-phosphate dehydrogenase(GAP) [Monocercomonoides exilis]|eukprot:MONOS_5294.1-p1 / transcript=MONOS_5294.1 / gene=MONOS_5294 / organism=Monocercomonoides_exilis_PA203 / gene_product=glyceraldehyde-3-phosphate dehydrogenase(GAP) / transcript_product=glyceraldehyde-3-phosphate dehydrogenase(GAP) / location=Mono_scaffold00152:73284-74342(-) / protein_length=353 / sequence_SO=supercontig / SO=protein_coding / is_pseudo=false
MVIRVAINGFGRIGRIVFRILRQRKDLFKIVAIHDLAAGKSLAHLLKWDTVYRKLDEPVSYRGSDGNIMVGDDLIYVLGEKTDPSGLPWDLLGIDVVIESTGIYRARANGKKDGYDGHIKAGAKKVIITVPTKDQCDATIVCGVNDEHLKPEHLCVSNASCTTNCLAPIAKVLNDTFGIVRGLMVTVHAYTNDQRICDQIHDDLRRARHAACNIIPTTTGAAKAVGEVIPVLKGKLDGYALRVPVPTGSCCDLTFVTEKPATKETVNAAIKAASQGAQKGIIEYCDEPIVSSDIIQNRHSSIFDAQCTMVKDDLVKIVSWYDNEWGYSNRVVDLIAKVMGQSTCCCCCKDKC